MHVEEEKGEYSNLLLMQPTTQSNNGVELEAGDGCVWPVKVKNSGVSVMKWVLLHLLKLAVVASVYFMVLTKVIKERNQACPSGWVLSFCFHSEGYVAQVSWDLGISVFPSVLSFPPSSRSACLEALRQVWLKTSLRRSLNPDYKTQHALFLPQPHHTPAYRLDDTHRHINTLLDGLLSGVVGLAWSAAVSNGADRQPCSWRGGQWDDLSLNSGFGSPTNWILTPVSLKSKLRSVHSLPCIFNQFRRFKLGNATQQICFF